VPSSASELIRITAPFCGMDCFHLHWRWTDLSERRATDCKRAEVYRGWGKLPNGHYQSHSTIRQPLVPPNQMIRVYALNSTQIPIGQLEALLGNPNSASVVDESINLTDYQLNFNIDMHSQAPGLDQKRILYMTDILNPNERFGDTDSKQVILEQGCAMAIGLNIDDDSYGLLAGPFYSGNFTHSRINMNNTNYTAISNVGPDPDPYLNPTVYMDHVYDGIRYFATSFPENGIDKYFVRVPEGRLANLSNDSSKGSPYGVWFDPNQLPSFSAQSNSRIQNPTQLEDI
jgi:hypothetical protein